MDPVEAKTETPPEPQPLEDIFGSVPDESEGEKPSQTAEEKQPEKAEEAQKASGEEKPESEEEKKAAPGEPEKPKEPEKSAWESDDNPYKKRYSDTAGWATTVQQQNAELKRSLEIINKKLDGTYDDPEAEKSAEPTPDQIRTEAEMRGKVKASEALAYQVHGKDKAEAILADFHKRFDSNPAVQYRVLYSDAPALEAIKVMGQADFVAKWGEDPAEIEKKIREDHEKQMEKTIEERVTKTIMARLGKKEQTSQGIGNARGSADNNGSQPTQPATLKDLFG